MFQYLVMTEISGFSSISVASCSPITWFFSSASIKSRTFLPKEYEPELFYSAFNMYIFQNDQVHFLLFLASDSSFATSLFTPDIHPLTESWTKQHQAYDFSVQASYLSCLWAFLNEKSTLSCDLIQWKNCWATTVAQPLFSNFWILSLLAVRSMHISLINLIRHTVSKNISAKPKD